MQGHNWELTPASKLFLEAEVYGEKKRYATAKGIAFEAKPTGDGTWHGFPIPWEHVPNEIKQKWLDHGKMTKSQIRRQFINDNDISWALDSKDLS